MYSLMTCSSSSQPLGCHVAFLPMKCCVTSPVMAAKETSD